MSKFVRCSGQSDSVSNMKLQQVAHDQLRQLDMLHIFCPVSLPGGASHAANLGYTRSFSQLYMEYLHWYMVFSMEYPYLWDEIYGLH